MKLKHLKITNIRRNLKFYIEVMPVQLLLSVIPQLPTKLILYQDPVKRDGSRRLTRSPGVNI